jgi:non-specific serine/threonine protein kinase
MLEQTDLQLAKLRREEEFARRRREFAEHMRRFCETVRQYNASTARRRVHAGRAVTLGPSATDGRGRGAGSMPGASALTRRQLQIAELVARGYTNQQIADALVLTPGTVANHMQAILERLGVRSRTQIAVWYSQRHHAAIP